MRDPVEQDVCDGERDVGVDVHTGGEPAPGIVIGAIGGFLILSGLGSDLLRSCGILGLGIPMFIVGLIMAISAGNRSSLLPATRVGPLQNTPV